MGRHLIFLLEIVGILYNWKQKWTHLFSVTWRLFTNMIPEVNIIYLQKSKKGEQHASVVGTNRAGGSGGYSECPKEILGGGAP